MASSTLHFLRSPSGDGLEEIRVILATTVVLGRQCGRGEARVWGALVGSQEARVLSATGPVTLGKGGCQGLPLLPCVSTSLALPVLGPRLGLHTPSGPSCRKRLLRCSAHFLLHF